MDEEPDTASDDPELVAATGTMAALRLIRHRNFGPYFIGNAASASGTWFQNLAAALLIYRTTHSTFLLGVLNFSNFIPVLILAPWAGPAADRLDRRRLIVAAQVFSSVVSGLLAGLAWEGLATTTIVMFAGFFLGTAQAFASPAANALVGELVAPGDLVSAIALNNMTFNIARTAGPALAAVAVTTLGIPAAFAINSGSYLLLVAGALAVRPASRRRAARGEARLGETLRSVLSQQRLLAFLVIVAAVGFAADPVNTEAPAFATAFHRHDTWAGLITGFFGAGAVTAAFVLAGRTVITRRRMIATLALLGCGVVAFSLLPSIWLAFGALSIAGFGYLASHSSAMSGLQLGVAEHERGRVMALWSAAFLGLRPFASLLDGAISSAFGVRVAGIVLASPILLGVVAFVILELASRARRRTSAST